MSSDLRKKPQTGSGRVRYRASRAPGRFTTRRARARIYLEHPLFFSLSLLPRRVCTCARARSSPLSCSAYGVSGGELANGSRGGSLGGGHLWEREWHFGMCVYGRTSLWRRAKPCATTRSAGVLSRTRIRRDRDNPRRARCPSAVSISDNYQRDWRRYDSAWFRISNIIGAR